MFHLFTSHHQAEKLRIFLYVTPVCKKIPKFFGLMMIRKELKHVAK
jgi:hypothetical protein